MVTDLGAGAEAPGIDGALAGNTLVLPLRTQLVYLNMKVLKPLYCQ